MIKSTFLTFVGIVASLVGFIGQEAGASGWGFYAVYRSGFVLVALGLVSALLFERRPSLVILAAQLLAGMTAIVFVIVAIAKYYSDSSLIGFGLSAALSWGGEANLLATAALAFGLTLQRRRSVVADGALATAVALAVGSGIYAITLERGFAGYVWWLVAGIGAFLAAAAAAGLERGGGVASGAPVASGAGGGLGGDPGVE